MGWYNLSWLYRVKVTVDNTKVPNTDQLNYPALITEANMPDEFWGLVKADGSDIVATSDDEETKLKRELVSIDTIGKKMELHVKVPTLSESVNTDVYIYFGNAAASETNDTETWDINYVFVSHMQDDPDTSHVRDSSQYGNHGTKKAANQPIETAGKIGKGQNFPVFEEYIDCGTDPSVLPDAFTAEFIGKTTDVDFNPVISWQPAIPLLGFPWYTSKCIIHLGGSNYRYFFNAPVDVLDGNFHHIAFTAIGNAQLDIQSARMLADGQAQNPQGLGVSGGLPNVKTRFWIGSTYKDLEGVYDEIRLSKIVRTDDWLITCYNNHDDPASFYSVGAVETPPVPPPTGGIPPLILRPPPRQTPFTKRAILLGQIRRPFSQYGSITGRIRRLFTDNVVFSATAVKHIDEEIAMRGFVVVDDISKDAWEAFFRELENEPVEEELIE